MTTDWFYSACPSIDQTTLERASERQLNLTKPPGSLGLLEDIAVSFCGWQNTLEPQLNEVQISVFAGDHGVCEKGVSAFPQAVTAQMVNNFIAGGAAISVLARELKANFQVINMGIISPIEDAPNLVNKPVRNGTQDFTQTSAMSAQELSDAQRTFLLVVTWGLAIPRRPQRSTVYYSIYHPRSQSDPALELTVMV